MHARRNVRVVRASFSPRLSPRCVGRRAHQVEVRDPRSWGGSWLETGRRGLEFAGQLPCLPSPGRCRGFAGRGPAAEGALGCVLPGPCGLWALSLQVVSLCDLPGGTRVE